MKLTRREIENVAANRVLDSYRAKTTKYMIIYSFAMMILCLPLSFFTAIAIWIFFLGIVFMLMLYTIFYYYRIKPKAKTMAKKLYEQMLAEEDMVAESGPIEEPVVTESETVDSGVDPRSVASIDEAE